MKRLLLYKKRGVKLNQKNELESIPWSRFLNKFPFCSQIAVKYIMVCPDKSWRSKQKFVISWKPSALLWLLSALGALGRRFESCHLDSNKPIHRQVSQPVFFFWLKYDIFVCMSYLCHIPVFAELFADIYSSSIYFLKDKNLQI